MEWKEEEEKEKKREAAMARKVIVQLASVRCCCCCWLIFRLLLSVAHSAENQKNLPLPPGTSGRVQESSSSSLLCQ